MQSRHIHAIFLASALALAAACSAQGGDSDGEPALDLDREVCSTSKSSCPVVCVGAGCEVPSDPCLASGGCEPSDPCLASGGCDPLDPCEKSGGCEPPDPCPKHLGQECPPPSDPGCTLSQGFWKNHPDAWPLEALTLGGSTYSKSLLLALFREPVRGNAALNLLHQAMAASLNLEAGADPSEVEGAYRKAIEFLALHLSVGEDGGELSVGFIGSDTKLGTVALALKDVLDAYNNGEIGPGHCDDRDRPAALVD